MIMFSQISFFLLVLIHFCLQNQVCSSPVILWSNGKLPESPVPLSKLSALNLISDYICKLPNEQIQLQILAVNDLTIEDIQRGSQSDHSLLLDAKKDQTNYRFYPNVNSDLFNQLVLLPQSNNIKCSQIHFQVEPPKIYNSLDDALNIMKAKIDQVGTDGNNAVIIALVNHPTNSEKLSRQKRQTNPIKDQVVISNNKTCMFHAKNLTWNDKNGAKAANRGYDLNVNASSCISNITTNGTNSSVVVNLVWINQNTPSDIVNMRLIATLIGRYWYLTNATLNNNEYRYFAYGMHDTMGTPPKYSYACTTATFVRYNDSTKYGTYDFTDKFNIKHFQFQPFYVNGSMFGPPNYCTSFFTSGIWMGITSSLLCLGILLFGIHRMMSIKSNDRFDDPKGKPLIIKAQE